MAVLESDAKIDALEKTVATLSVQMSALEVRLRVVEASLTMWRATPMLPQPLPWEQHPTILPFGHAGSSAAPFPPYPVTISSGEVTDSPHVDLT